MPVPAGEIAPRLDPRETRRGGPIPQSPVLVDPRLQGQQTAVAQIPGRLRQNAGQRFGAIRPW